MLLVDGSETTITDGTIVIEARPIGQRPSRWLGLALGIAVAIVGIGAVGPRPEVDGLVLATVRPTPARELATSTPVQAAVNVTAIHALPGALVVHGVAANRGPVRVDVVGGPLTLATSLVMVEEGPFRIEIPTEVGAAGLVALVVVTAQGSRTTEQLVVHGHALRSWIDPATGLTVTGPASSPATQPRTTIE